MPHFFPRKKNRKSNRNFTEQDLKFRTCIDLMQKMLSSRFLRKECGNLIDLPAKSLSRKTLAFKFFYWKFVNFWYQNGNTISDFNWPSYKFIVIIISWKWRMLCNNVIDFVCENNSHSSVDCIITFRCLTVQNKETTFNWFKMVLCIYSMCTV